MTLFGSVLGARNAITAENPLVPLTDTSLLELFGGQTTKSGTTVSETTALGLAAVWRAVQVTSNVPASLPFHAFRQDGDARVVASGHAARLMDDPHPDMTRFELWQTIYVHRRLWATPTCASCVTSSARSPSCGRSTRAG